MLKKFMKKTKTVKAFLAVGAAVTMLLGTSLTVLAADNTTTPRVIAEADANVIATSDATQLYLTGSITTIHDGYGSPDPQLINNGDGSWVLIMYKGQTIALGVNNPYTAYTEYVPQIDNTVPKDESSYFDEDTWTWVDSDPEVALSRNGLSLNSVLGGYTPEYGYSDIYNNVVIKGSNVGSSVYNLTVGHYLRDGQQGGTLDGPETLSNTVTLAIYVLEAQEGAQDPIYTVDQQNRIDRHNSLAGTTRGTIVYFGM